MRARRQACLTRATAWVLGILGGGVRAVGVGGLVMACSPTPLAAPLVDPPPVVFRDVSAEAGLPKATKDCMVFRDFDGDGAPDLLLSPLSPDETSASLALFTNNRDGTFTRVDIPTDVQKFHACAVADYDGDGRLDIALIDGGDGNVKLFHNESNSPPRFALDSVHPTVGAPDPERLLIAFVDLDADGWPDLYLASSHIVQTDGGPVTTSCKVTSDDLFCQQKPPVEAGRPVIFHNDKGKGFVPSGLALPPPHDPWPWGLSAVDWDEDGAVDLFLCYDYSKNQLLHNGGGTFTNVLPSLGDDLYGHGMGAAFADYNHDGHWDFWVADLGPDQVWMSGTDGAVTNQSGPLGVEAETWTRMHWGPIAVDLNNDGFDDVFVGNQIVAGSAQELANSVVADSSGVLDMVDDIFVNVGGARFNHQSLPFLEAHFRPYVINAIGDFDGDGRQDVLEGPGPLRLLRNETPINAKSSHWLDVRLHGARSALNAHGALVSLEVDGAPFGRHAAESHDGRGNSSDVLHFGLGAATSASAIRVLWPGGATQTLEGPIMADQILEITHP